MQDKIRQLKNLLATKDARQLRKDGEALLKEWEEEEEKEKALDSLMSAVLPKRLATKVNRRLR